LLVHIRFSGHFTLDVSFCNFSSQVSDKAKKYRIALDLQSKVKAEQSKLSNGVLVSFNVDRDSIGRLIGTGGANIRAAKKMPGLPCSLDYGRPVSLMQVFPGINRIDLSQDGVVNIFAESREKVSSLVGYEPCIQILVCFHL
jgi:hypothetical protein